MTQTTTLLQDVQAIAESDATTDELLAAATQAADRAAATYVAAMRDALFAFATVEVACRGTDASGDVADRLVVALAELVALAPGGEISMHARSALCRLTELHQGVRIARATDVASASMRARLAKAGVTE